MARNQPTYDFLSGGEPPMMKSSSISRLPVAKSSAVHDTAHENLRAQLNTVQYELDAIKQERELTALRHEQDLRDAQSRAEADFQRAQAAESAGAILKNKTDALVRDHQETQSRLENERSALEKKVRGLQDDNRMMREELEEGIAERESQERQHRHAMSETQAKYEALKASVDDLQEDLVGKVAALQTTQQKLVQRENEVGELENEVLRLKAQTGDTETLGIIKKELSEQVAYIQKLEGINREQLTELKYFRKSQKSIEVIEEEKRTLEARVRMMDDLRKELAETQLQKTILEDEKMSWHSYLQTEANAESDMSYETPEQMAKAFLQERLEKLSLVDKLGSIEPELNVKEDNIRVLQHEKAQLSSELERLRASTFSANGTTTSVTDPSDMKARLRLERQKNLVTKEVEYLRAQMKTLEAEQAEFNPVQVDEDRAKRVHDLEDIVEQYRSELQTLHGDLSRLEAQLATPIPSSPKKRFREDEGEENDERLGELQRKNRALQANTEKLQTRYAVLEAELKASTAQLKAAKDSSRTRILELRGNPTAAAEAIKMSTLRTLREENAALLAQLEGKPHSAKVVPISTLDNIRDQCDELQAQMAQAAKKTTRLKQIWGSKSLEFREAVCSILGWKLDFMPNGRVKATSILHPTTLVNGEEEENSIVFDGENGTMKVSGGPQSMFASEIKGLIEFWVEGRKEIPCFLAACTLEFYDRTTRATRI